MTKYIFTHIPKTSGTSFKNNVVYPTFNKDKVFDFDGFNRFSLTNLKQYQVVCGLVPYGLHYIKPIRNFKYITFLRDPVERAISHYYFILQEKWEGYEHPSWSFHNSVPLKDVFDYPIPKKDYTRLQSNLQTKYIAGLQYWFFQPNISDIKLLNIAKTRLKEEFIFTGIKEKFEFSCDKCATQLGWKFIKKEKTYKKTKSKPEIDNATRLHLENVHELDIELYEFAKKNLITT